MEDTEKIKTTKTKKSTNSIETHQSIAVITNDTIRGIVKLANEKNIRKEDIVSLLKENGQFVLVYFK